VNQFSRNDDSLRAQLRELHGPEIGQRLFEEMVASRAATERRATVQLELRQTQHELGAALEVAKECLVAEEAASAAARVAWLRACAAVERAKIDLQQIRSQLRSRTQSLLAQMNPPPPAALVQNWGRPSWYQPEVTPEGQLAHGEAAQLSEGRRNGP
jgi:hypothetical protein